MARVAIRRGEMLRKMWKLTFGNTFASFKAIPYAALPIGKYRFKSSNVRVQVKQGELEGTIEDLPSGDTYASFKGIPYAKPPIGDLRFRAPLAADKWNGVRSAKEHGEVCPQFDMFSGGLLEGSEDCLYLNVYSPHKNKETPLPVMVWLHGGAFFCGSGDSTLHGPEFLVEEGVVVVTMNYRLEALGFLCLDTQEVPGNAGMKDQVLALRWVKENISQFGGDPNNVTISGESAGGSCATLHMVCPMSQGLGHKFISQSGTFFNEWSLAVDPRARAFRLAKYLGRETSNTDELLKFLRSVPATKITSITKETQLGEEHVRGLPIRYAPNIEKRFPGQECFMPAPPEHIMRESSFQKRPLIIGYNNLEGALSVKDFIKKKDALNADFTRRVPRKIADKVSKEQQIIIADKIKQFYFDGKDISKETTSSIVNIESDYNFSMDILRFAKTFGEISPEPVFLYRFEIEGELNLMRAIVGFSGQKGACHGDDLFYLFKSGYEAEEGSKAMKALRRMTKMWTNFAKHGNPTPAVDEQLPIIWKPISKEECNFLQIDFDLKLGKDPDNERYEFWTKLHENF